VKNLNSAKLWVLLFFAVMASYSFLPSLKAAPMDVEKDNDAIGAAPTPDEDEVGGDEMTSDVKNSPKEVRYIQPARGGDSDVTFNYFLTSGYVANDISNIPSVGKVIGTPELDGSLSTAKSLYVLVPKDKTKLEPGEKLIVFGDDGSIFEKKSGFDKRYIKNLAILRVREGIGNRYLTDVVTSYDFIPAGSPVKLYSGEKNLWDRSQVAKEAPTHPIKCYVAGGDRAKETWNQNDFIILTAGTKDGVVEGLGFELMELPLGKNQKADGFSRGFAKVFYAGSYYSLARIQNGAGSISTGFEAYYKP
jgi:hypothetical protein